MTVWFDVEDLFEYARLCARPSGIQRLSYEIYSAAHAGYADRIGFLRHDPIAQTMRTVDWADVDALYRGMIASKPANGGTQPNGADPPPTPLLHSSAARTPVIGNAIRAIARRLPGELRQPLGEAARAQIGALRALLRAARAAPGALARRRPPSSAPADDGPEEAPPRAMLGQDLRDLVSAGDTLAVLGSPWSQPDYGMLVERLKKRNGMRFAMLVYDLIPLVRPEFCDRGLVMLFSAFMRDTLPLADRLMAISEASATDVARWAAQEAMPIQEHPIAIPIGTGFSLPNEYAPLPEGITAGGYALFVSTIEARKNHLLAFRAWRRLLDELPAERMPKLVFAGRVGWMVADLMQQIRNAESLGGKLMIVENPDDATLAALYRGARFTLFPSLYEGWGLPVSESLAFGKVCLASNSTSIPEAGGRFCLYHDPDSVTAATALYRRAIEEAGLIESLEATIAAEYRPTPWSVTARSVLDALN
jgi:glycosyltransferase involved in cell wall biosynthesis